MEGSHIVKFCEENHEESRQSFGASYDRLIKQFSSVTTQNFLHRMLKLGELKASIQLAYKRFTVMVKIFGPGKKVFYQRVLGGSAMFRRTRPFATVLNVLNARGRARQIRNRTNSNRAEKFSRMARESD